MKNHYLISALSFLIIVLFNSCFYKKSDTSNHELEFIKKTERINQNIICREIGNILFLKDSIFLNQKKMVLLLTMSSDCAGCREKGYKFVSRINEICKGNLAFVVGMGLNEEFEKRSNGLPGKIYQDERSTIKQKLKLFHTPSLVLIDRYGKVDHVLSIFPYDDVKGYNEAEKFNEFLMAVLALN